MLGDATGSSGGNRMQVTAAFYPLQYVAERIGGDAVEVTSLTPAGGEPHDLELTPQDLATLQASDLVVHLSGFQPAVDEAIAQTPDVVAVDAATAPTSSTPTAVTGGRARRGGAHRSEHGEDEHGGLDPHFWLDTSRLSEVAAAVEEAMAEATRPGPMLSLRTWPRCSATSRASTRSTPPGWPTARSHRW
jgi:zinc transport system substrate-binding protein